MRDIILVLSTMGWEKLIQENNPLQEIRRQASNKFKIPLEGTGCTTENIHNEFTEMMDYAINFIPLSTMDHSSVW